MKKSTRIAVICIEALLLICLLWVVVLKLWSDTESRCTVKVEDDLFSIGMESMNESRSESFQLEEGISVAVYVGAGVFCRKGVIKLRSHIPNPR